MRKSFTILLGILVCAINALGDVEGPALATSNRASAMLTARLALVDVAQRINQARQLLQSTSGVSRDSVRLAVVDPQSEQLSVVQLSKDEFLTKDAVLTGTTSLGSRIQVQIVRANGVNTAVKASEIISGQPLIPLLVQFPIVKDGGISEVAYYTSAHPDLLSPELTASGQSYVHQMLDEAANSLAAKGVSIPVDIVDVAEHLCVVEHTDHKRFNSEDHGVLFPEILSLYGLNQGNTFRYSVSTAGAGGMIQMIPRTYEAIRQNHPGVPLDSDFVTGMRDHANALTAMLLYMNDTWNGLARNTEVQQALNNGLATKPELLAAGYNSNPMRLPVYLKTGGSEWRTLVPAETKTYLAIYSSVDQNLHLGAGEVAAINSRSGNNPFLLSLEGAEALPLWSWLGESLVGTLTWFR